MSLTTSGQPEQVQGRAVYPGFFWKSLDSRCSSGAIFLPAEGEVGKEFEVILTHKIWKNRFGGERNILGQKIRLDGLQYTVVGVLAARRDGPRAERIVRPR